MSFIHLGEIVRLYYEEFCFDEGRVIALDPVTVDFLDWIEVWTDAAVFTLRDLYHEGIEVLIPVQRGVVVLDFWAHMDR